MVDATAPEVGQPGARLYRVFAAAYGAENCGRLPLQHAPQHAVGNVDLQVDVEGKPWPLDAAGKPILKA